MTSLYDPRDAADISRLIAGYPLAWIVSRDFHASPLPLLAETGANGAVTALFGVVFVGLELYEFAHLVHEGAGRSAAPSCRLSSPWWARTDCTSRSASSGW